MPTEIMDLGSYGSKMGKALMGILGGDNFQAGFNTGAANVGAPEKNFAQAGLYNAQADALRQRAQYQKPEFGNQLAAAMAGLVGDQPAQMARYQETGNWGERAQDFGPETLDANQIGMESMPAPNWATPEKIAAYSQGRAAHLMNLAGTGDSNANQMADAYAGLRKQGGIDRATVDPRFAGQFGQAQAAAAGKPLYDNAGGDMAFNQFTGQAAPLSQQEAQAIAPLFGKLFGQPHHVVGDDAGGWQIMPVSGSTGVNPDGSFAQPVKAGLNTEYARTLGIDDARLTMLGEFAASDPKTARMVAQGVIRQALRPAPVEKLPSDYAAFQREKADGAIPAGTSYTTWKRENARSGASNQTVHVDSRPVPAEQLQKLTSRGVLNTQLDRLRKSFRPEYAGYKIDIAGDAANWAKRAFGDNSGQASWWQDYQDYTNKVRHELFGAALTGYEIEQWNKANVSPGMDPAIVRTNLSMRAALEKEWMDRIEESMGKSGFVRESVKAATAPRAGAAAPSIPDQPLAKIDRAAALRDAKEAIAKGAPRAEVIKRLKQMGIDSGGI